jgi:hypothetical protein
MLFTPALYRLRTSSRILFIACSPQLLRSVLRDRLLVFRLKGLWLPAGCSRSRRKTQVVGVADRALRAGLSIGRTRQTARLRARCHHACCGFLFAQINSHVMTLLPATLSRRYFFHTRAGDQLLCYPQQPGHALRRATRLQASSGSASVG